MQRKMQGMGTKILDVHGLFNSQLLKSNMCCIIIRDDKNEKQPDLQLFRS